MSTALAGCLFGDCPGNFGGIKNGQLLETTVVAPYGGSLGRDVEPCGELGDLVPGTTTTWLAHLKGSGESCEDSVLTQPQSLSDAALTPTSSWTTTVTLASGCTGSWSLAINTLGSVPNLIGPSDPESPSWVLERTFQVSGDATLCAGGALPSTCTDAFVAETRQIDE